MQQITHTCGNLSAYTSRRNFMRQGMNALLLLSFASGASIDALGQDNGNLENRRSGAISLPKTFELVRSKFAPHLSEYFTANINGEAIHFQLIEVADLKQDSIDKSVQHKIHDEKFREKVREESFTLLFRADTAFELKQATYRLKHDTLGDVELFLVPVERKSGPWRFYEAVFNRLQQ